jgi:hypothetical protein
MFYNLDSEPRLDIWGEKYKNCYIQNIYIWFQNMAQTKAKSLYLLITDTCISVLFNCLSW